MPPVPHPDELRDYLLGRLDDDKSRALEDSYVADEALLGEIGDAEQDLIADYLAGRLATPDRRQFDTHYLASPVHRARVATARALQSRRDAQPGATVVALDAGRRRTRTVPQWRTVLLAAAGILMAVALLWVAARQQQATVQQAQRPSAPPATSPALPAPAPSTPDRIAQAPGADAPAAAAPDAARPPAAARPLLAITLTPGITRGDRQRAGRLPPPGTDLLLHLEGTPESGDTQYQVEIQTVDGTVVWSGRARRAAEGSGRLASVRVPGSALAADDYIVVIAAPQEGERERYTLRLHPH